MANIQVQVGVGGKGQTTTTRGGVTTVQTFGGTGGQGSGSSQAVSQNFPSSLDLTKTRLNLPKQGINIIPSAVSSNKVVSTQPNIITQGIMFGGVQNVVAWGKAPFEKEFYPQYLTPEEKTSLTTGNKGMINRYFGYPVKYEKLREETVSRRDIDIKTLAQQKITLDLKTKQFETKAGEYGAFQGWMKVKQVGVGTAGEIILNPEDFATAQKWEKDFSGFGTQQIQVNKDVEAYNLKVEKVNQPGLEKSPFEIAKISTISALGLTKPAKTSEFFLKGMEVSYSNALDTLGSVKTNLFSGKSNTYGSLATKESFNLFQKGTTEAMVGSMAFSSMATAPIRDPLTFTLSMGIGGLTTAGLGFGADLLGTSAIGRGIASSTAFGITEKAAAVGLIGLYGTSVGVRTYATSKMFGKIAGAKEFGTIIGSETTGLVAGGYLGSKINFDLGMMRVPKEVREDFIQPYKMTREGVVFQTEKYPTAPTWKHLKLLEEPTYGGGQFGFGLKGEEGSFTWHVTPTQFAGETIIAPGTSELPMLYGSSEASLRFSGLTKESRYSPLGFKLLDVKSPTAMRIKGGEFERLGRSSLKLSNEEIVLSLGKEFNIRPKYRGQIIELIGKEPGGTFYVPEMKSEIEAGLRFETSIKSEGIIGYTRVPSIGQVEGFEGITRRGYPEFVKRIKQPELFKPGTWGNIFDIAKGKKSGQIKYFGFKQLGKVLPIEKSGVVLGIKDISKAELFGGKRKISEYKISEYAPRVRSTTYISLKGFSMPKTSYKGASISRVSGLSSRGISNKGFNGLSSRGISKAISIPRTPISMRGLSLGKGYGGSLGISKGGISGFSGISKLKYFSMSMKGTSLYPSYRTPKLFSGLASPFGGTGKGKKLKHLFQLGKQPKKYQPSLYSIGFGIKGKQPKSSISGITIRPLSFVRRKRREK